MLKHLHSNPCARSILTYNIITFVENSVYKQSVRWAKKPPWMPIAKSKMFRVPQPATPDPEEEEELKRLTNNYNTCMKSIRAYLQEEIKSVAGEVQRDDAGTIDDDLQRSNAINDAWNAEVAKTRELRLIREREERLKLISETLKQQEEKERMELAVIEEMVKKEKERAQFYITPDNIDEAIENALRTEVDYNFAIDVKGNLYKSDSNSIKDAVEDKKVESSM